MVVRRRNNPVAKRQEQLQDSRRRPAGSSCVNFMAQLLPAFPQRSVGSPRLDLRVRMVQFSAAPWELFDVGGIFITRRRRTLAMPSACKHNLRSSLINVWFSPRQNFSRKDRNQTCCCRVLGNVPPRNNEKPLSFVGLTPPPLAPPSQAVPRANTERRRPRVHTQTHQSAQARSPGRGQWAPAMFFLSHSLPLPLGGSSRREEDVGLGGGSQMKEPEPFRSPECLAKPS